MPTRRPTGSPATRRFTRTIASDHRLVFALWCLGLDVLLRGLSMIRDDNELPGLSVPLFDGLYEYRKQALRLGREPS